MAELPAVVVDVHSHVFNAEDLPIDGFVKRQLAPTPRLLTAVISGPLDAFAQWRAPGAGERARLLELLASSTEEGLEGIAVGDADVLFAEPTDEEVAQLFAEGWGDLGLVTGTVPETGGLEGVAVPAPAADDELAAALGEADQADVAELDAWLDEWDEAPVADEGLEGIGDVFGKVRRMKDAVKCFLWSARLAMQYRHLVASRLATTYEDVSLFVPALVDFDHPARDLPSTSVQDQIAIHSLVAKLSVAGRLPGAPNTRVHPFVGFDPFREISATALAKWDPDKGVGSQYVPYADPASTAKEDRFHRGIRFDPARARSLRTPGEDWATAVLDLTGVESGIDLVRHAVELGGFAGVKVYPPAGFLPLGNAFRFDGSDGARLDAAMRALFGYCEAMEVPVLTHAAYSNGFAPGYDGFASPMGWELVLAEYPQLRLCLGHFGHMHGAGTAGGPWDDAWFTGFVALIDRYPHVYADLGNSKFAVDPAYRERFVEVLRELLGTDSPDADQQARRRRLLYGSDFWMNTLTPGHDGFLTAFRDGFTSEFGDAVTEAFLGRNALRYLGFTGDDDEPDFANRNRQRIEAFYGDRPRPPWLPKEGGG